MGFEVQVAVNEMSFSTGPLHATSNTYTEMVYQQVTHATDVKSKGVIHKISPYQVEREKP